MFRSLVFEGGKNENNKKPKWEKIDVYSLSLPLKLTAREMCYVVVEIDDDALF